MNSIENGNQPAYAAGAESWGQSGLTKREYFAGLAMQAMITSSDFTGAPENVAEGALQFADALLAELNKETT